MSYAARSLKTDFQNATIRSIDQPSGFGTRESYRPETAHTGQREPSVSLIRSPGGGSGRKRGRVIGGDHYGTTEIVSAAVTSPSNVTQPEYGAGNRRRTRKSPSSAAITRRRSARVVGITGIQIAAAHDPVVRIAEINGECARAGRAKQRRIIRVPGVPLIRSGEDPGDIAATPVAIHAFRPPCVVTQVPLDAKETSPAKAGGMLLLISSHVIPLVVRKSGNTPLIESPCRIPRCGVQNAKPS